MNRRPRVDALRVAAMLKVVALAPAARRRAHEPGAVVGKALEPLRGGTGVILALVTLH